MTFSPGFSYRPHEIKPLYIVYSGFHYESGPFYSFNYCVTVLGVTDSDVKPSYLICKLPMCRKVLGAV